MKIIENRIKVFVGTENGPNQIRKYFSLSLCCVYKWHLKIFQLVAMERVKKLATLNKRLNEINEIQKKIIQHTNTRSLLHTKAISPNKIIYPRVFELAGKFTCKLYTLHSGVSILHCIYAKYFCFTVCSTTLQFTRSIRISTRNTVYSSNYSEKHWHLTVRRVRIITKLYFLTSRKMLKWENCNCKIR